MNGYFLVVWIVAASLLVLPARAAEPDSLLRELLVARDTTRINLLNQLGEGYLSTDTQRARKYVDSALAEAHRLSFTRGVAEAQLHRATLSCRAGNPEEGARWARQALALYQAEQDGYSLGKCYRVLGNTAYYRGEFPEAKRYYERALAALRPVEAQREIAKCYANLGLIFQRWGDYDTALQYFFRGLSINESLRSPTGIANNYLFIANTYVLHQEYESAIIYFQRALRSYRRLRNPQRQASALMNVGLAYLKLHNPSRAIRYYQRALTLADSLDQPLTVAHALNNLGFAYLETGKDSVALPYLRRALTLADTLHDQELYINLLENVALVHQARQQPARALELLKEALLIARTARQKELIRRVHRTLSNVYTDLNDYRKALAHHQQAVSYQDSLFNEEKSRQIAELRTRYEVEKKEQLLEAREQKISWLTRTQQAERQVRWILLLALGLLFLLILFIYNQYQLKQRSAQLLDEKNREIEAKNDQIGQMNRELEKRMLRAQMNPHFIFNSLNAIQHFITISDKTSALKYLATFSKLVRRVLEHSVSTQVPLADEITLLKHYIELERLRYSHPFDYAIHVDASVDIYETEIPFLLIQPYVENALVHGLRHQADEGHLRIELKQTGGYLMCVVEDNGIGRAAAQQRQSPRAFPSRGMSVTRQRLEALNHGKAEKTSVRIQDLVGERGKPAGTRVEIMIPQTEELCCVPSL